MLVFNILNKYKMASPSKINPSRFNPCNKVWCVRRTDHVINAVNYFNFIFCYRSRAQFAILTLVNQITYDQDLSVDH